jgi:transposase
MSQPLRLRFCGGRKFGRIDADEREVLEYVPSHFKRVLHVRPKMSCRICETIVQAPMPTLPIEKGRPGPALLAHVIVSKYCDHLPLHRQSDIYARSGVEIDRSVMAGWVGHMAALLEPLSERIARHVRAGGAIHADDTPVPVLDPGRGRTKTGQYGRRCATSAPMARRRRRRPSIATRPTAKPSTLMLCCMVVVAFCTPMAMPALGASTSPIRKLAPGAFDGGRLLGACPA